MDLSMFKDEVIKLGIDVSDDKLLKLEKYYELLVSYNEKINLTSITQKDLVYLKHFYDSLTVVRAIDLNGVESLCDIGTGAGFPGIVLKIFFPHLHLTLVDCLLKRVRFLDVVVGELGLDDVVTVHARAEEYGCLVRGKFDVVTARAVSSINVLLEYSMPILKVSGYFVAMRGSDDSSNLNNALNVLKCRKSGVFSFRLPVEDSVRTIILFKKLSTTDKKYPRKNSIMKKYPL